MISKYQNSKYQMVSQETDLTKSWFLMRNTYHYGDLNVYYSAYLQLNTNLDINHYKYWQNILCLKINPRRPAIGVCLMTEVMF